MGHTPTPWSLDETDDAADGILGPDGDSVCVTYDTGRDCYEEQANAAFIVRAVNAHDALVEALEMVRDADEDCRKDGLQTIPTMARAKIDAALALAKEKK